LAELYASFDIEKELGISVLDFISSFRAINAEAWREFRNGDQTKDEMRANRFVQTFFKYGSGDWKKARQMSLAYLEICPYKGHLIDGAKDLLDDLIKDHSLHIITNGFSDTQRIKLTSSGIVSYFKEVVISEETPFRKPEREIFVEALKRAKAAMNNALMVGDDWHKDIQGAKRAGIDQVFFNPEKKAITEPGSSSYEVVHLSEISKILK
jgi:putative hydrolase of the HAD superfamily